ncbi:DUF6344 domain-containing protein [Streptomyces sp. NPDC056149]|uniref:DUF6344 domain-containing protein n=1 Tax=Streptomyces sp. NPDC056149 TaxID=3345728 RepID=UPI0035DA7A1C
MAATKVMKFWAVCLAVLGKLLASLGVSAAASAARREAAVHQRTTAPDPARPEVAVGPEPDHEPRPLMPADESVRPFVPAARTAPWHGQDGLVRRRFPLPTLPPTIKQRIRAEAHGSSPTARRSRAIGGQPLSTAPCTGAAPATPVIPAARRRAHTTAGAA